MIKKIFKRKFVRDSYYLQIATLLQTFIAIVTSAVIARSLGTTEFGKYALVFILHSSAYSFVLFGVARGTMALYSGAWSAKNDDRVVILAFYFKAYLAINITAGIIGFIVAENLSLLLYDDKSIGSMARWLFVNNILVVYFSLVVIIYQATRMVKELALFETIINIIRNSSLAVVAYVSKDILFLVYTYLIISALSSILGIVIYIYHTKSQNPAFPKLNEVYRHIVRAPVRKYIGIGIKIRLGKVIPEWMILLPQNILGIYTQPEMVGFFRLALNLVKAPQFLFNAMSRNVLAKYYEVSVKDGKEGLKKIHTKLSTYSGFLSISIYLLFFLSLPFIVEVIYGDEYAQLVEISKIMIISMALSGFVIGIQQIFIIINKQYVYLLCTIVPFITLAWVCVLLTKKYGVLGAAIYIVFLEIVMTILKYSMAKMYLKKEVSYT